MADPTMGAKLIAKLIGYFPLDGDYLDPIHNLAATPSGNLAFAPAWDERRGVTIGDGTGKVAFPQLTWKHPGPDQPPPSFALSFWFKTTAVNEPRLLFNDGMGFRVIAKPRGFEVGFMPAGTQSFAMTCAPGQWFHFAACIDYTAGRPGPISGQVVGTISFFINGRLAGQFDAGDDRQATFGTAMLGGSSNISAAGVSIYGCAMFFGTLSADEAAYLACDLFHPESTHASSAEYLAARLDGASCITCTDAPILDFGTNGYGFTITAWLQTAELSYQSENLTLIERQGAWRLGIYQGVLTGIFEHVNGTVSVTQVSGPSLEEFTWVHIAFIVDQQSRVALLYVNGEVASTMLLLNLPKPVPQAKVSIGAYVSNAIYGVGVYGRALDDEELAAEFSADVPTEGLPHGCIVYYDLSASPPAAISDDPALRTAPTVPSTLVYDVFSRGLSVGLGGHAHCGYDNDTILPPSAALTIEAWILLSGGDGTRTILSRFVDGRGYRLFLQDGKLCGDMAGTQPLQTSAAAAKIVLPPLQWIKVGACFANGPKSALVRLYVNGRLVAQSAAEPGRLPPEPLVDPSSPLLIGARYGAGADGAAASVTDGFEGFVQRVMFYPGLFDLSYATYAKASDGSNMLGQPVADWFFDDPFPRDLTDDEPVQLRGPASVETHVHYGTPAQVARLSSAQAARRARHLASVFSHHGPYWHPAPAGATAELTPAHMVGCVEARRIDGMSYLVAHAATTGAAPDFLLLGDDDGDDALWVALTLDMISFALLRTWGLQVSNTKALAQTGLSLWRNAAIRAAITAMAATESTSAMPAALVAVLVETYRQGFISRLLSCYRLSFFVLLRIVAMFAPWAALALIIADLARIAGELLERVRTRRRDKEVPPAVTALCIKAVDQTGSVPVLVNGDRVLVSVALVPPPKQAVSVSAAPGPLQIVPRTLEFSPGSGPQQVVVTLVELESKLVDRQPVPVTWRGTGVVGEGFVPFRIRVLDLDIQPAEPDVTYDKDLDAWTGEFTIEPGPEIASDAVLTATLSVDAEEGEKVTFDPATLTWSGASLAAESLPMTGGDGRRRKTVKAKWQSKNPDKKTKPVNIQVTTTPPARAGDGLRRSLRLQKKTESETVLLTMVAAGKGLCLVVKNQRNTDNPSFAVIDGGVSGTYDSMSQYLPSGTIDYVVCTHFDDDHINGLITLMQKRGASVGKVLFNPPPGNAQALIAAALAEATSEAEVAEVGVLVPLSVTLGKTLNGLAQGKLISQITALPPPSTLIDNVSQPTLRWKFGGPFPPIYGAMMAAPGNGRMVNLASLIIRMESRISNKGFNLMVTGDATDKGAIPSVTGVGTGVARVQFLQVPHHGSDNNSDKKFYAALLAEHYLISSSWSAHKHPRPAVISAIIGANRDIGRSGYTLWISDPNFHKNGANDGNQTNDYDGMFPKLTWAGEYTVNVMNTGQTGLSFTVENGSVTAPASGTYRSLGIALR